MKYEEEFTCWWGRFSLRLRQADEPPLDAADSARLSSGVEEVARDPLQRLRLGVLVGGGGLEESTPRQLTDEIMRALASGRLAAAIEVRAPRNTSGSAGQEGVPLRKLVLSTPTTPRRPRAPFRGETTAACDFDAVTIRFARKNESDHGSERSFSSLTIAWRDGALGSDLPDQASEIGETIPVLELVAGSKLGPSARTVSVAVEGGPGFACEHGHPRIVVHPEIGGRTEQSGARWLEFAVLSREAPTMECSSAIATLRRCHDSSAASNRYFVVIDACGRRSDGGPARMHVAQPIAVYPADAWSVTLTRPGSTEVEHALQRDREGRWREAESVGEAANEEGVDLDAQADAGPTWSAGFAPEVPAAAREPWTVELERNSEGNTAILELALASPLAALADGFARLLSGLGQRDAQLGARIRWSLSVLEGSLRYAWSWREGADRRVRRAWTLEADLVLFDLRGELSYGFMFSIWRVEIEALLYGTLALAPRFQASAEATQAHPTYEGAVRWELPISLGIRAKLGADWLAARGEITSGVVVSTTVTCGDGPLRADFGLEFMGVRATLRGEVKLCGVFVTASHAWVFAEPQRLFPATPSTVPSQ